METLLKADIFFFVTTCAVGIVAVCIAIITFYFIKILKDIKHISETLSREGEKVADDIDAVRETLKEKGSVIGSMIDTITKTWRRRRARS